MGLAQSSVFSRHAHDEVQIGAYEGGLKRFWIHGREVEATAGHLVVVPSGEPHASKAEGAGTTFRVVFLGARLFETLAEEVGRRSGDLRAFGGTSPCHGKLLGLVDALASGTSLRQETLLLEFVAGLLGAHGQPGTRKRSEPAAIKRARRYLHDNVETRVTLGELSREVGMSKYHLLRTFRELVGLPPHAYLTHLRITRSRALLRAGMPPADVAAVLGFVDQSHFARHFRREVGVSPGRFQRYMSAAGR